METETMPVTEVAIDQAMVNLVDGQVGEPITLPTTAPTEEDYVKAGRYLMTALPNFLHMVDTFPGSAAQLKNVMKCAAEYPLNQRPFHFGYPHEKELFDVLDAITSAKLLLLNQSVNQVKTNKENQNG